MEGNIVKIADLSEYANNRNFQVHETLTIRAWVTIKSSLKGTYGKPVFFMDLRDDSGDISAAAVSTRVTGRFFPAMQENQTYTITGFRLQDTEPDFTSVPHPKMIYFEAATKVEPYGCARAAPAEWPLTPLSEIDHDRTKHYFVNVIGVCTAVGETKRFGTKLLRKVTLEDEQGGEGTLGVWAKETALFDRLELAARPVVLAKDARIEAGVGLTPTRYLHVLAPDDPRARRARAAYCARRPD